jgi:hypothetical protein
MLIIYLFKSIKLLLYIFNLYLLAIVYLLPNKLNALIDDLVNVCINSMTKRLPLFKRCNGPS